MQNLTATTACTSTSGIVSWARTFPIMRSITPRCPRGVRKPTPRCPQPPEKNAKQAIRKWNNIRQGNADIDEVPHKHYLKEELQLLLANEGFIAEDIQKIEYNWDTEFIKPPKWLKEPRPWDWMVVARKK